MSALSIKKPIRFNILKFLVTVFIAFLMVIIVIYPDRYVQKCTDGIKLWAVSVLPSLLPFFFLTAILTKTEVLTKVFTKTDGVTRPLFNVSGVCLYAFAISVLSGYPVGSKCTLDLFTAKTLSQGEAKRTGILASTSGPLFVIGAVGTTMFNNKFYGLILYLVHIISAILTAITFKNYGEKSTVLNKNINFKKCDNVLYESIYSSVISVLIVGGFIAVFYVISSALFDFKVLTLPSNIINAIFSNFCSDNVGEGFVSGIIECTKGCYMLSSLPTSPITLSLCAYLISFGGISIIMQSLVYLNKVGLKPSIFCLAKLTQATYSFVIALIIFSIIL